MTDTYCHEYRYERKFAVSRWTKHQVESVVKLHPAFFSEIFSQRFVNNIYFDSPNLKHFFDNIEGNTHRKKIRIRWYGTLFGHISSPVLEIKSKNGWLGTKQSYLLQPFTLDRSFGIRTVSDIVEDADIPEVLKLELNSLVPVLLNRYSRRYFLSADGNYRITLDTDMAFYKINRQANCFMAASQINRDVILELKYLQPHDVGANTITTHLPFRLSKSSKYVTGLNKIFTHLEKA